MSLGSIISSFIGSVNAFTSSMEAVAPIVKLIFKLFIDHYWLVVFTAWLMLTGAVKLMRPNLNLIDSAGLSLYLIGSFVFAPIPIPLKLFGVVLGADLFTASILLVLNLIKAVYAFIFVILIAWSCFNYSTTLLNICGIQLGIFGR